MTEMRILLVGDGNHQFITNFVCWLKKDQSNNFFVDILSYTKLRDENRMYFNSTYGIDENILFNRLFSKIKGVRRFYRYYLYNKLVKKLLDYDIVHFHFLTVDSYYLVQQFRKRATSRIIISIWGSDMYRVKQSNSNAFIRTCKSADSITFTNQKSLEFFSSKYRWSKTNLYLALFGSMPLEYLRLLKTSNAESKKLLNWNPNKMAVTIGYNLATAQQHIEILSQFGSESIISLRDRIQLIIPITYSGTLKYKNQLLDKLKQLPFEFYIYDTFLKDEQVAQIRKASDVMIQLQLTDQFSGSMQEYLYTRNVVITGSWLPYETIKKHGAWFIEIESLEELSKVVPEVINDFEKFKSKTKNNPQAITKLISWEKNIQAWIDLYNNK